MREPNALPRRAGGRVKPDLRRVLRISLDSKFAALLAPFRSREMHGSVASKNPRKYFVSRIREARKTQASIPSENAMKESHSSSDEFFSLLKGQRLVLMESRFALLRHRKQTSGSIADREASLLASARCEY